MKHMFWNFQNRFFTNKLYKSPLSGLCRKCLSLTNHFFFYTYILWVGIKNAQSAICKKKFYARVALSFVINFFITITFAPNLYPWLLYQILY